MKTGRRQQLTRQLITARVQVIAASPTRIHRALLRNVYMVTTQAGSKRLYYNTIARPPPPASSSLAAALERMPPVASDHRGADWMDAVTRPSHRRCAVTVGGLVRRRLQLQLRLVGGRRCMGGLVDGGLRNNHVRCLSNEKRIWTTRRKFSCRL